MGMSLSDPIWRTAYGSRFTCGRAERRVCWGAYVRAPLRRAIEAPASQRALRAALWWGAYLYRHLHVACCARPRRQCALAQSRTLTGPVTQ
jgi:hypothetical protein